jgi:hypothetical protein
MFIKLSSEKQVANYNSKGVWLLACIRKYRYLEGAVTLLAVVVGAGGSEINLGSRNTRDIR